MAKAPLKQRITPLLEAPGARVTPVHAAQLGFWRLEEAAAFTMGFDRKFLTRSSAISKHKGTVEASEFLRRIELVERAIEMGDLAPRPRPHEVLKWADAVSLDVPQSIREAVLGISPTVNSELPPSGNGNAGHPDPDQVAQNVINRSRSSALSQKLNSSQRINCGLLRYHYKLEAGSVDEGHMSTPVANMKAVGVSVDGRTLLKHFIEGSGLTTVKKRAGNGSDSA